MGTYAGRWYVGWRWCPATPCHDGWDAWLCRPTTATGCTTQAQGVDSCPVRWVYPSCRGWWWTGTDQVCEWEGGDHPGARDGCRPCLNPNRIHQLNYHSQKAICSS